MIDCRALQGQPKAMIAALALAMGLALVAGCSQPRPVAPSTLIVPKRIDVTTIDLGGVYDAAAAYANGVGLTPDTAQSNREQGRLVTQSAVCAPNGDQRHTARCVFSFLIAPAPDNPTAVAVQVRVRAAERVPFDPNAVAQQVRVEATLDQLVTALRGRFGTASVVQTDMLEF